MATERQTEYLRDLGIDPRADTDDLAKADSSDWITELQWYAQRAKLAVGTPLTPDILSRLGARADALAQPPTRSLSKAPENGSKTAAPSPGLPPPAPPASKPRGIEPSPTPKASGDESWVKVELSTGVTTPLGEGATVTVSASAHHRHGPNDDDAEELGTMVRRFLEREVARSRGEYVSADAGEPSAEAGPARDGRGFGSTVEMDAPGIVPAKRGRVPRGNTTELEALWRVAAVYPRTRALSEDRLIDADEPEPGPLSCPCAGMTGLSRSGIPGSRAGSHVWESDVEIKRPTAMPRNMAPETEETVQVSLRRSTVEMIRGFDPNALSLDEAIEEMLLANPPRMLLEELDRREAGPFRSREDSRRRHGY
ncbi:MAG TPA: hypothetical protein VMH38_06870 [Thermoplasmata archaeon]|nr:hypothetical protein [Thermoplasmata archaeon]